MRGKEFVFRIRLWIHRRGEDNEKDVSGWRCVGSDWRGEN